MAILTIDNRVFYPIEGGLANNGCTCTPPDGETESNTNGETESKDLWKTMWNKAWTEVFDANFEADSLTNAANLVYFKVPDKLWMFVLVDPRINVTFTNTIAQTPLIGKKHSIKEYIGGNDYEIVMTGTLMSAFKDAPPLESLALLRQCVETQGRLIVYSGLLLTYGITRVVLKEFKLIQQVKDLALNTPQYSLTFVADPVNYEKAFNNSKK